MSQNPNEMHRRPRRHGVYKIFQRMTIAAVLAAVSGCNRFSTSSDEQQTEKPKSGRPGTAPESIDGYLIDPDLVVANQRIDGINYKIVLSGKNGALKTSIGAPDDYTIGVWQSSRTQLAKLTTTAVAASTLGELVATIAVKKDGSFGDNLLIESENPLILVPFPKSANGATALVSRDPKTAPQSAISAIDLLGEVTSARNFFDFVEKNCDAGPLTLASSETGGVPWSNPNGILRRRDGVFATATGDTDTEKILVIGFGDFNVPDQTTIKNVKVKIEVKRDGGTSDSPPILAVDLVTDGEPVGKLPHVHPIEFEGRFGTKIFGEPINHWGLSDADITPKKIASKTFGFAVWVKEHMNGATISLDSCLMRIYYQ